MLLGVLVLLFIFDWFYFVRAAYVILFHSLRALFIKPLDVMDESTVYGICLTTDLDLQCHMNNARYMRECDFARYAFWVGNSLLKTYKRIIVSASTIRYRRSLQLLDIYMVKTKAVSWDNEAIYLEQNFIRRRDNFICAAGFVKMKTLNITPQALMNDLSGREIESPAHLPDLAAWIEFNKNSKQRLSAWKNQ